LEDTEYADMLLEYKLVQKRLEDLDREEGRIAAGEKNKENQPELAHSISDVVVTPKCSGIFIF